MNTFWRFLIKDPLRKIIALSLTIVLYAVMNEGKQQQKNLSDVLVEIKCDSDVFLRESDQKQYVRLTVRGSESRIKQLNVRDIKGQVNISGDHAAFFTGRVNLDAEDFQCPRGIEIVHIEPAVLNLPLQRQISRDIPICPDVAGTPRQGRECVGVRNFPESVTVTGPEKEVAALHEIRTEQLNIDGESMTFDKEMRLINPMPGEFSFNVSSANISVTIVESSPDIQRKLTGIPVRFIVPSAGTSRGAEHDRTAVVTVSGSRTEVNNIARGDIIVYVDLNGAPENAVEFNAELKALLTSSGKNVKITAVEPAEMTFHLDAVK